MKTSKNAFRIIVGATIAGAALAALFAQNLRVAHADTSASTQTPMQLFSEKCSACHNVPAPQAEAMTKVQWLQTVNRMLYRHGAKNSISPSEVQTILTYLNTFAVAPATFNGSGTRGGHENLDSSDVWETDPVYSHVYVFRNRAIAAPFRRIDGQWSVRDGGNGPSLIIAAYTASKPALLVAPTPAPHGDLEIEADFRTAPPPNGSSGTNTRPPLTFGVTFDTLGPTDYDLASYDDAKRELTLTELRDGSPSILQSVSIPDGLSATPDGWHKLKVNIVQGRAKVWLDFDKKIDSALPTPPGNGAAGICTGTRAAVKSFILDLYPTVVPNTDGLG